MQLFVAYFTPVWPCQHGLSG